MKTVKKIFSLMLVFLVGFALTLPANASDKVDPKDNPDIDLNKTTGNITIQKRGSTFSIYKILNAEAKAGQNVYNYTVNKDFDGLIGKKEDGKKYSLKDIADMPNQLHINKYDNGKIESVIDPITELTSNFTSAVQEYIDTNNIQPIKTIQCPDVDGDGAAATAENLEIGFYIIIETGTTSSSASVSSRSMLVPLPYVDGNGWNFDLEITPKDEPVNVDKSIIEDGEKENVSTNNVGDVLDYQVEADIPHYDASTDLASVKYIITDSLSKGLDFAALLSDVAENKKEVVITVDDLNPKSEPVKLVENEDYTISYSASENGENKVMTINFDYSKIKELLFITT